LSCLNSKELKKKAAVCIGEFGPILPKKVLETVINKLIENSKNRNKEISK